MLIIPSCSRVENKHLLDLISSPKACLQIKHITESMYLTKALKRTPPT